ncbi:MAG TPA: endonuclease/exonuclease/phosphatase family protein [Polyangiaceae bacterium]|nr:endonuclease/exonuclease/phosphatase family protein [Polyangiaceae bacterium]
MSFNILDGAEGTGPENTSTVRLDAIVELIESQKPDLLVLCECNGFEQHGSRRLHEVEQHLGMQGSMAVAATGYHVAIFARDATWVSAKPLHGFYHAALRAKLVMQGEPVTVVGAHLCPFSAQLRLVEAEILANEARADERVILMGDLNSLSPLDDTREILDAMPPRYQVRHRGASEHADTRALEVLMKAGFIDLADRHDAREYTCSTSLVPAPSKSPLRIDYILATPLLARHSQSFAVCRGPVAEQASDHYAVVAAFD